MLNSVVVDAGAEPKEPRTREAEREGEESRAEGREA
jgi:hypothetical protein